MKCRHCHTELQHCVLDLGSAPPSNAYLTADSMKSPELWFPLRILVCDQCWLVQTEDFAAFDQLFDKDYAYFSSFSASWLAHARCYTEMAIQRFDLTSESLVIEVAANDGYLLQYFKEANIPSLGIEPTDSTAQAARKKGIEIIGQFFGVSLGKYLAQENRLADLTVANNVLAHVPDINDFVSGFAAVLKPDGVSTFEFPSLLNLLNDVQFDTIYHEHFSYLSLSAVNRIFAANGLSVFDVQNLDTHGGSLRVFAQRADTGRRPVSPAVADQLAKEADARIESLWCYENFQKKVDTLKNAFVTFLIDAKKEGKKVMAYGAAAKGNTLINYAGVHPDLLSAVIDKNPAKQGKFLPGSRIPICSEAKINEEHPDYIAILPWNLKEEITSQLRTGITWGVKIVTFIPTLQITELLDKVPML